MENVKIPPAYDHRWVDLVTGKISPKWELLALQMLMFRVVSSIKKDPSPKNIDKCIQDVRTYMEKNIKIAQSDIANIFK